MRAVKFEPTIPASKRAETVHALDCAATLIGSEAVYALLFGHVDRHYLHIRFLLLSTDALHKNYIVEDFVIRVLCDLNSFLFKNFAVVRGRRFIGEQ
jgi:hypothetical protein